MTQCPNAHDSLQLVVPTWYMIPFFEVQLWSWESKMRALLQIQRITLPFCVCVCKFWLQIILESKMQVIAMAHAGFLQRSVLVWERDKFAILMISFRAFCLLQWKVFTVKVCTEQRERIKLWESTKPPSGTGGPLEWKRLSSKESAWSPAFSVTLGYPLG